MNGLLIKSPWIDLILAGKKTWEIRGRRTATREPIALIKSKSGLIVGVCRVVDCIGPLTPKQMQEHAEKHQIPIEELQEGMPYPKTYAWVLAGAKPLEVPIPYRHPSGAVIWVRLTPANVPQRLGELSMFVERVS